jgi:hypothetical protein
MYGYEAFNPGIRTLSRMHLGCGGTIIFWIIVLLGYGASRVHAFVVGESDPPRVAPPGITVPAPAPPRSECYDNKNFGPHCKGESCRPGEIGYFWNCDVGRKVRLKCEDAQVSVDYCPKGCLPNRRAGTDDTCRR